MRTITAIIVMIVLPILATQTYQAGLEQMLKTGGMAYSDVIIYQALQELLTMFGSEAVISQHMIADHAGMPAITVQRALKRLMASGKIKGEFERGKGYRYTIPRTTRAGR